MAQRTLQGTVLLFLLLGSQVGVRAAEQDSRPGSVFSKIDTYARLGSGESFTLSKEELSQIMGQEEAEQLFASAQESVQRIEQERWWKNMITGLIIGLSVALALVYVQVFKK